MVDSNGNVVQRNLFDSYGNMSVLSAVWTAQSDLFGTQVGFQGMWLDAASGLYHTPNRDYSVALGRWAEPDPSGASGSADNLYQFVDSSPESVDDPTGLRGRPELTFRTDWAGREILDHWLGGTGTELTEDSEQWNQYMRGPIPRLSRF